MKPLLALLLVCAVAPASARTPFQARCEVSAGQALAVLSSQQGGYRIDNTLSYRALTRMKEHAPKGGQVLGLTHTEARVTIGVKGRMLSDPASGNECVAPRIDVALVYLPIVIYIGREFPPASCAYQAILAHEMRHLNVYLDYLPKVESVVRAALARRFAGKPLYARAGQARAVLQREIEGGWLPYIQAEMAKVEPLQAAIDTPQEYSRLGKVCQGEVQSLIGSAKRTTS